jgi:hypothetical protein
VTRVALGGVVVSGAAALAAAIMAASPALAASGPPPGARLQGAFAMTGRVTAATAVRGEHRGQVVQRLWQFTPLCPRGACATVSLVRARAHGSDQLTLHRLAPHYYSGMGTFYAPLKCAGKVYPNGDEVPFKITVRVTAGAVVNGATVATAISASYANRSRTNRTPCVGILGHDAARYTGLPTAPAAPSGGGGTNPGA